jgi:hypothetical protein
MMTEGEKVRVTVCGRPQQTIVLEQLVRPSERDYDFRPISADRDSRGIRGTVAGAVENQLAPFQWLSTVPTGGVFELAQTDRAQSAGEDSAGVDVGFRDGSGADLFRMCDQELLAIT